MILILLVEVEEYSFLRFSSFNILDFASLAELNKTVQFKSIINSISHYLKRFDGFCITILFTAFNSSINFCFTLFIECHHNSTKFGREIFLHLFDFFIKARKNGIQINLSIHRLFKVFNHIIKHHRSDAIFTTDIDTLDILISHRSLIVDHIYLSLIIIRHILVYVKLIPTHPTDN